MLKMGAIPGKDYHTGTTAPILSMLISLNPNGTTASLGSQIHIKRIYYFLRHYFLRHYFLRHYFLRHYFLRHYFLRHYFLRHYFLRHHFLRHYFLSQNKIAYITYITYIAYIAYIAIATFRGKAPVFEAPLSQKL